MHTDTLFKYMRARWPKLLLLGLWGVACFLFFQSQFPYHFFLQEQNQLFLNEGEYLLGYFSKPAWLACMAGDFLTQFYYYLYAGPAILAVVLTVLGDASRRVLVRSLVFSRHKVAVGWGAALLALLFVSWQARLALDENYRLCIPMALLGGLSLWLLHDKVGTALRYGWMRATSFLVSLTLAFWCFGLGMVAMLLPEMLRTAHSAIKKWKSFRALTVTMLIIALVYTWIPAIEQHYCLPREKAVFYPGTGTWVDYSYAKTYETVLALDNEYHLGHYQRVVDLYESLREGKNDQMAFFYCLSLAQMGVLPERLRSIDNPVLGTFLTIGEKSPLYTIRMINELYYLVGDMTYAERAAQLANTFSPQGRNVRMVKRLAEANLVKGDIPAATKYLRLLAKTTVHRQWAKDHTPGSQTPEVKAEIARKHEFINTNDDIRLGDDCYTILTQLLDSNPRNTMALHFLLCSDMLSRQRNVFIADYERYGSGGSSFFEAIYKQAKQ